MTGRYPHTVQGPPCLFSALPYGGDQMNTDRLSVLTRSDPPDGWKSRFFLCHTLADRSGSDVSRHVTTDICSVPLRTCGNCKSITSLSLLYCMSFCIATPVVSLFIGWSSVLHNSHHKMGIAPLWDIYPSSGLSVVSCSVQEVSVQRKSRMSR